VSTLYVSFFYEALEEQIGLHTEENIHINLALHVAEVGDRLRRVSREEAGSRLELMAEKASDPEAAAALRDHSSAIREGPEQPFAHHHD
jgi:hypothetical protein